MIKGKRNKRFFLPTLALSCAAILVPAVARAQISSDESNQSPTLSDGSLNLHENAQSGPSESNPQSTPAEEQGSTDENVPRPPKPKTLTEEIPSGETVEERPRPDYTPFGQRVGSFIFFPNLGVQESFESNILGTPTQPIGDFITSVQPSLDIKSDWNNHALDFHADGSLQKYLQNGREDYNDYTLSSNGRLDIYHDAEFFGGIGYSVRHQPIWSPNNPGNVSPAFQTAVPGEYGDLAAAFAAEKTFNRLSFRLQSNYDDFTFSDVTSTSGISVPEHLENYNQELLTARVTYELAPLRQIYLLTSYDWRNYVQARDLSGYDRTSSGYVAEVGTRYDLTGITFVDVYAGYLEQAYKDTRLPRVTGPTGGAKLTWNVTPLTTITGSLDRSLQEAILPGASGYFDTRAVLRADHELLRNVVVSGSVGFEQDAFQGLIPGIAGQPPERRTDDYYLVGAEAKYLLNRNFSLSLSYTYTARDSTQSINNFNDNIVLLGLSTHF